MTITSDVFRTALGHFASGVAIITSIDNDEPVGMSCQSLFALSLEPPLVAIGAGKASRTWPRISSVGKLCVNILGVGQEALSRSFAISGSDKFSGVSWRPRPNGTPMLEGCIAWIDCEIEQVHETGDHFLAVAKVMALETAESIPGPLLFFRGAYGHMQ